MTLIVNPKNKKQEKIIKAFLQSLEINFYSEEQEDTAVYNAMLEAKNSPALNRKETAAFIERLKGAK